MCSFLWHWNVELVVAEFTGIDRLVGWLVMVAVVRDGVCTGTHLGRTCRRRTAVGWRRESWNANITFSLGDSPESISPRGCVRGIDAGIKGAGARGSEAVHRPLAIQSLRDSDLSQSQ